MVYYNYSDIPEGGFMERVSEIIDRLIAGLVTDKSQLIIIKKEKFLRMLFLGYSSRPKSIDGKPVEIEEAFSCLDFYGRNILAYKYGLVDGKEKTDDQLAYFYSTIDDRSDRTIEWVQKIEQRAIATIRKQFPDPNKKSLIS